MKARFFALAALVLGLASCQNDFDGANVGVGGEVDFQLAVAAPEFGATRADQDGQNGYDSAFGAIDYLSEADWANVDLRYSLEVYDYNPETQAIGNVLVKDRMVKVLDKYEPVVFELRLVPGRHYHFVVFADFVEEGSIDTPPTVEAQANIGKHHVIGATLADITLKNDAINTELTDAYFATDQFEITNSAAKDMTLRRPYGKVRVVATDLHELNLNVKATSVKVTYTAANANAFNAVYGTISGEGAKTFEATYNVATDTYSEYTVGYDDDTTTAPNGTVRKSHMTLSTDYILAVDEQKPIQFNIEVFDQNKQPIKKTAFSTDIPVQRNYLTTVIGNVLTSGTEINISINDDFAGEKNWPETNEEDLAYAAMFGGEVTLTEDITLDKPLTIVGDAKVVINLNGKTLTGAIALAEGGALSANNGTIKNTDKTVSGITSKGNLTLDNVTIESARHGVRVESGKAVINGGVYRVVPISNSTLHAVNIGDDGTTAEVVIKGGTFIGPKGTQADSGSAVNVRNGSSVVIEGGNFSGGKTKTLAGNNITVKGGTFDQNPTNHCAEGYKAIEKDGKYYVVPEDADAVATSAAELTEALANGENVVMTEDIAVAKSEAGSNGYGATGISQLNGGVIDGNGNDISVNAWGTWDSAINTTGGTIKNLNVTGGMRGIFVNHNSTNCGKVILDNVTIDGTVYTISCDQGTNNGLEATNSTFNGWTSYAATIGEVKFTNCSFGEGQGYAYCRPYAPTAFVNCDFAAGYSIDARALVTFENCTIDGVALTVENINTLGSKSANMKLLHNGEFVSVASNPIENQAGVTYNGEFFENTINDALYFNNWYMTGDATIQVVDKTYGAIILENVSGDINGDVIYIDNDNNSVMILENCDFTLAEGKKLIKSVNTIYQVFMANITINGVKLTNENAGQYLENVGWFEVVEEI